MGSLTTARELRGLSEWLWNGLARTIFGMKQIGRNQMLIARFLKDESGATAIEYGLIAAGISVAIIAVVQGLGSKLKSTFTSVQNALN
jgi:pilus assembly protein Flp/PilA